MRKVEKLFDNGKHKLLVVARESSKLEINIDINKTAIRHDEQVYLYETLNMGIKH